MVTAEHLDEARARLAELETLTGHVPGTEDWFEAMGEAAGIEPLALREFSISRIGAKNGVGQSVAAAVIRGLLVGLIASQYANQEREETPV